jgi:hypothetical protein
MRQIEIFESDFPRLQALAVPFVDSPATVITKLLDERQGATIAPAGGANRSIDALVFGPESVPPLRHTKVMSATFDQQNTPRATWDSLVRSALLRTKRSYGSIDELRRVSGSNIVSGSKIDDGYKPVEGEGFSFQGLSAEDAIKVVVRCARALRCPFSVEFVWRDKEGAHRPGRRGVIQYSPT